MTSFFPHSHAIPRLHYCSLSRQQTRLLWAKLFRKRKYLQLQRHSVTVLFSLSVAPTQTLPDFVEYFLLFTIVPVRVTEFENWLITARFVSTTIQIKQETIYFRIDSTSPWLLFYCRYGWQIFMAVSGIGATFSETNRTHRAYCKKKNLKPINKCATNVKSR